MKFIKSKKGLALFAVMVVAVVGAVAGYAYFSASGSGSGTATVGSASSIAIAGSAADALYPGQTVTVPITVSNPGSGNQLVQTVHASAIVASSGGSANASCLSSWFTLPDVAFNTDLGPGSIATGVGTLTMTDANTSQNACQGNSLALSFTSN